MATAYEPPNTFYSQTFGLFENEDMYKFIGKNGAHFKHLTQKLGLDYIWWNKETNVIELWGPHYRLQRAKEVMDAKLAEYMRRKNPPLERARPLTPEEDAIIDSYVASLKAEQ